MRILWFMNQLPNEASAALGGELAVRGGWLDGLTRLVAQMPNITLTVATDSLLNFESTEVNGVRYINVSTGRRGRLSSVRHRWCEDPSPERNVERCRRLIREIEPDLVHVHGTESYFGLAASTCDRPWLVSLQGIPSVITDLQWRGVDSAYLGSIRPRDFVTGYGVLLDERMMRRRSLVERAWMPACRHVMGRTRWDRYVASILAPSATYHHCDEILRDAFMGPKWSSRDAQPNVLLATSGSYPLKGTGQLLEAFAIAASEDASLRLRIAGIWPGTSAERATKAKIRTLHLQDRVKLLGLLSAEDLAAELLGCAAFVHPSHIDNSPNSLCEAMMLGTPVVATAVGGIPSLVTDGLEGLLVQDGDRWALAGAVLRIVRDPTYASALGRSAQLSAHRRHDRSGIERDLKEAYDAVLKDFGTASS